LFNYLDNKFYNYNYIVLARPGSYERLEALGARLAQGWQAALRGAGVAGEIARVGSVLWPCLQAGAPPRRYDRIDPAGAKAYATTHRRMLERGVWLAPSYYEVAFVSTAHDEASVDAALAALRASLAGD
jgi:glutamate-1-semialdehyde 2,1-aminomutase